MGSNTNFLSTIEARSLGTADLDKMVAAIDKQSSALENLGKQATKVNDHAGFPAFAEKIRAGIENPLQGISGAVQAALSSLGPLGTGVAAAGGIFAAAATTVFSFAKSLGEYGQTIQNAAARTGLSTKEVAEFSFAARVAGQDVSVFERLMRGLSEAVQDNSEKGAEARVWLRKFGVDINAVREGSVSTSQVLLEVANGLNKLSNTFERNKAALDLFKRAGVEVVPVMMQLRENLSIASEKGFAPSDAELARYAVYQKHTAEIEASWGKIIRHLQEGIILGLGGGIGAGAVARSLEPKPTLPNYRMGPDQPLPDDSSLDARVAEHVRLLNRGLGQQRSIDDDLEKLRREGITNDAALTPSQRELAGKLAQEGISSAEKQGYRDVYGDRIAAEVYQRNQKVAEASATRIMEALREQPPETGWDRAAAEARQAQALYAVKDPLRLLQSPFSAPTGYLSPEEQLRTARDQSARGLGLYSLQANLGGVTEGQQTNQLYQMRLKYADDEYAALKRLAETRDTEDEKQQAREDAMDQLRQKRFDADMERQQSLLQIALQQKGASEATASGLFDAIHSRTTNQYWRQFAVGQERQLFTNAASPLVLGATRFLGGVIPGQTDAFGNPTDIGKLLHGTLLDSANADPSKKTAENTLGIWTEIKSLRGDLRKIITGSSDPNASVGLSSPGLYDLPSTFNGLNPTLFGSGGLMGTGIGTSLYNLPSATSIFTNPLLNPGLPSLPGTSGFAQFLAGVTGGPSAAIASFAGAPRGTVGYGPDGTPHDQYGNPITSSTATQIGQGVSIAGCGDGHHVCGEGLHQGRRPGRAGWRERARGAGVVDSWRGHRRGARGGRDGLARQSPGDWAATTAEGYL